MDYSASRLPPGPSKLPIIGSMHHLLVGTLPHITLRNLSKIYGPLMHLKLGEVSTVVVTSREIARELFTTHDLKFASRPNIIAADIAIYGGMDILFAPYGAYWRQIRKICVMEILSAKRVLSFRHVREEEVLDLVKQINSMSSSHSTANLSEMLHSLTNNITSRVAFGMKCKDVGEYLKAMKEGLELASGFNAADLFPSVGLLISSVTGMRRKLERCCRTIDTILEAIIEERREIWASMVKVREGEAVEGNILDVLFNLQAQGGLVGFPFTQTTIKAVIFDIFAAGSGTAASSMTWTMSELIRNPRVMKKLQAEIREALRGKVSVSEEDITNLSYLQLVIKESLRLHPPAPLLVPRECTETCKINGHIIPKKSRVIFNAWAMGRDPRYWDNPEEFKPERFESSSGPIDFVGSSYEYIPFGGGRRICPGVHFGLATMGLTSVQLLYHFDWGLPQGVSELDMSESPGLGARRKFDLCLRATPYGPAYVLN
ncbi:premnaspirodiene oxygenase-like [Ananas comosus]|uniref:Premnaspirodiene oxygenase-like n=1 Tax=Ananas comosus TaxID=4615 RepID=A0A6P5GE93_ANACO|nr:premnaspirodiene oxygenase-like [Ananas comosus]